ncbi:uncharacterized protein LOC114352007 [Ostrinia furnacalis]|uniref:uncharacterized protein LOC114352007 n=1 Tax=Ostrinia furnacalis TaxID=93504 RepID=UPI0010397182|nr:uncharacterized protein LOC114352007 [Ostrinia furnacalis]
MRFITIVALAATMTLALFLRYCEGAALRRLSLPDDDEEFRPRPLYRDYLIRRPARADDAFDDYGHLRFGRSDD